MLLRALDFLASYNLLGDDILPTTTEGAEARYDERRNQNSNNTYGEEKRIFNYAQNTFIFERKENSCSSTLDLPVDEIG